MGSVDRSNLDLSRFQFSCPGWWRGFTKGRVDHRAEAVNEHADWKAADWQRRKLEEMA